MTSAALVGEEESCLSLFAFFAVHYGFPFGFLIFGRKFWCLWLKKSQKTPSYGYFTPPRAKKRSQYDGAENFLHLWGWRGREDAGMRGCEGCGAFGESLFEKSSAKTFHPKRFWE